MAARGGVNAKGENAPQPVKVQRYWPGKAPKGVTDYSSSEEEEEEQFERQKETDLITSVQKVEITEQEAASDRRLRRLKEAKEDSTQVIDRRRRHLEDVEKEDIQKDQLHVIEALQEVELDDAAEIRRRQLKRDRALEIRRQEEEGLKALEEEERTQTAQVEEEEEESDSEETSEYETDSEEEEQISRKLLKPVFIPKAHRETVLERERMKELEEETERKRLRELEERKKESHAMVEEHVQKSLQKEVSEDTGLQEIDDTDGLDEQAEYEEWKLRELRRVKRDKEERLAREKERDEIERRRNMSEEQRTKEDMERIKKQREEKPKGQYKFLQKYYHKGSFYMEDDNQILKRDYTVPTPDEVGHKEILPKVMQVKNFGRAGQTKWTHLTDQDTSTKDAPWNAKTEINKRTISKLGGFHGGFDKPTAKKRKS
ncbi:splicing factor, Prp19-binding domain-containing protein [Glomus cerebriforme]|uniref:Splicing factor, Prp19-binding domain-containing protein n=1 Tax=Glomus cerebriforme TaxID=658196 RepID=A0A397SPJ7_9GLOM|nr:splicing factor, Prp19-binding domain-containing protein [Glomus cerebriforme]